MTEAGNSMNWSTTLAAVAFCILAGIGAGTSVQTVLHSKPGWVLPFYGIVAGIFTGCGAVLLATILSSLKEK